MFGWFILFGIIIIIPVAIIGVILSLVRRRAGVKRKEWYLSLAFSKDDFISQFHFLLAFGFLTLTLLGINGDICSLLTLTTIIFVASTLGIAGAYLPETRLP